MPKLPSLAFDLPTEDLTGPRTATVNVTPEAARLIEELRKYTKPESTSNLWADLLAELSK